MSATLIPKRAACLAVDGQVEIRLAEIAQELDVMHARNVRHDGGDFFALLLESLQVVPENLERQRTLGAGHRFSDVVFDGLGEVPDRARDIFPAARFMAAISSSLFLMKYRPPLVVRLQIDEILGVAESAGVGSVVGPAHFRYDRWSPPGRTRKHSAHWW